jgi:DNA modification methylase
VVKEYQKQYQLDLDLPIRQQGPVECLGMTFENDEKRREFFLKKLCEKLKDPEFRKIEGFPIGEDEDILALSDPPYYTACPNPWIKDFIKYYGKPYNPETDDYSREPYATDVSEGKNDPIYNAHSYHTKVPHKAIMRYILHYTEPDDIVFDGFCGTGMTGVAAQLCGDKGTVELLGYKVDKTAISQREVDGYGKTIWRSFSNLGERRAVLNDLAPIATFIASNYNVPQLQSVFRSEADKLLNYLKAEWGWMYETLHTDGKTKGCIHYVVWSDVFICPSCAMDVVFFDVAYSSDTGKIQEEFQCPHCGTTLSKKGIERSRETYFDPITQKSHKRNKQVPAIISYSVGGRRYEKVPTEFDFEMLKKIERLLSDERLLSHPMMHKGGENWGNIWRSGYHYGVTHTHHFYTNRNFLILSKAWEYSIQPQIRWAITGILNYVNKKQSFTGGGGGMPGVLYIASLVQEKNVIEVLERKIRSLLSAFGPDIRKRNYVFIVTQSSGEFRHLNSSTVDYIFVDPPFGGNIMYSEGSFLWESWLKVFTDTIPEAIENPAQRKKLFEYQGLMTSCFKEFFRILKPGRWITVEFHNSQNRVWNAIQESIQHVGFIVADVRTLDKKQGSFKQVTSGGAVKQDLVISAYKPNSGLEDRFKLVAGTEEGAWDFVRTHLKQLPIFVPKDDHAEVIVERQNFLLFDRMVAFHVQRGVTVPMSAAEFYAGLEQRFPPRDGMYFLPDQAAEYDKKRMTVKEVLQLQIFVSDEASAIQWLKQQLTKKSQTFQDIQPQFLKEISGWQKHEKTLELSELLKENFLIYDGKVDVPSHIHSYLSTNFKELRNLEKDNAALKAKAKDRWYVPDPNKAGDLEKLRERALMREFQEYRESKQKRLKVFRLEAVRAGFKKAWQERDYATIIAVASKISENILQEDPKLLMWYDQALTRSGEE